jgi:hypothetical protein
MRTFSSRCALLAVLYTPLQYERQPRQKHWSAIPGWVLAEALGHEGLGRHAARGAAGYGSQELLSTKYERMQLPGGDDRRGPWDIAEQSDLAEAVTWP